MNNRLDHYRVFHTIAVEKNASRAAEKLFITQSAVSQTLRQLEESLGTRLFDRLPRGMELTAEGRRLFRYIESAMGLIDAGEREIQQLASLETGELFIAAGDTLCKYHLLPHIEAFHTQYPGVSLRITNRTSSATVDLLRHGRVDLGVVNMPCMAPGIETEPFSRVHDCFVTSDETLAKKRTSWEELARMPLLLLEQDTTTRTYLDDFARNLELELQPEFELGSVDLLVQFAKIGVGVSHVPREYVLEEIESGQLFEIRVATPIPAREIAIARRSTVPLSPAAERFVSLIRSDVKQA